MEEQIDNILHGHARSRNAICIDICQLQKVQNAPKTKWTQLRNRRLQSCAFAPSAPLPIVLCECRNWYAVSTHARAGGGTVQSNGMIQETLPAWILDQCLAVQSIAGTIFLLPIKSELQALLSRAQPELSSPGSVVHCISRSFEPAKPLSDKRFLIPHPRWHHAQRHAADSFFLLQSICLDKAS
jgi:hypothetical protein